MQANGLSSWGGERESNNMLWIGMGSDDRSAPKSDPTCRSVTIRGTLGSGLHAERGQTSGPTHSPSVLVELEVGRALEELGAASGKFLLNSNEGHGDPDPNSRQATDHGREPENFARFLQD